LAACSTDSIAQDMMNCGEQHVLLEILCEKANFKWGLLREIKDRTLEF
jgi:hypothetical protein